jgi:hypothetical protein
MPVNMPAPHGDTRLKCVGCRWFHQGYNGVTCRQTRQVDSDTRACIEFQAYRESPLDVIYRDKFIRGLEATAKVLTDAALKQLTNELKVYHLFDHKKLEPISYLTEEALGGLAHRFEICQAYMDRVSDLRSDLEEKRDEIQGLMKDSQAYLFTQYSEHVRSLKNDTERGAFYRTALPALTKALDKIETLLKRAELAHVNLKDTHYSMCRTQDAALKIWDLKVQNLVSSQRSKL